MQDVADVGSIPGCRLPVGAFLAQALHLAAGLNEPISVKEVDEGLLRLLNGRAKGMLGMPAEFRLRYAKPDSMIGEAPPVNVLAP